VLASYNSAMTILGRALALTLAAALSLVLALEHWWLYVFAGLIGYWWLTWGWNNKPKQQ